MVTALSVVLACGACTSSETRQPDTVPVPNLIGHTIHDAKLVVRQAHLRLSSGLHVGACVPGNTVTRQLPRPGTRVARGRTVQVDACGV
jgi:beta-lactam-binding protein with PASTA domain